MTLTLFISWRCPVFPTLDTTLDKITPFISWRCPICPLWTPFLKFLCARGRAYPKFKRTHTSIGVASHKNFKNYGQIGQIGQLTENKNFILSNVEKVDWTKSDKIGQTTRTKGLYVC